MIKSSKTLAAACLTAAAMAMPVAAQAIGWPANHQGVMLQGFYWDSYTDTKWTNLEANADEYSKYFNLIWVPNSAKSASGYMGYDPVYWFTNHTTKFGNEAELRSMIATYKEKGVGIIEDVVINHRSGKSNWTDFPAEQWNGKTWQIGLDGICSTDEVNRQPGQAHGTGAADTGEDFDGSRDLDHTNANVQENCKAYVKFLLEDLGYAGCRYDMTKGYGGQYTKIYNQANNVQYSVGEYWDGNYDAVAGWIDATGKTSAAFDFPCKYAINEAFSTGDMTKLVWKAYGTTDQPAGLIHAIYPQYAVTFVDNHDTYRDGSKFTGNVVAANAFILFSPGTPCVFLPHYKEHKAEIQKLIDARNACGISNTSQVKVLKSDRNCYMAEITGTKGKAVVKIGSSMDSPSGYSSSDIKASGNDYCVWTTTTGGGGNPGGDTPGGDTDPVTIWFDNSASGWTTPYIYWWPASSPTWPGVAMTKADGNIWKYDCPAGTTGVLFNAGDGDASKTEDFVAIHNHLYTKAGDQGEYQGGQGGGNSGVAPAALYMMGNYEGGGWSPDKGIAMDKDGDKFTAKDVKIVAAEEADYGYISFSTALGASSATTEWDVVNGSDRYGAEAADTPLTTTATMKKYPVNISASSCASWAVEPGEYDVTADFATMTVTLVKSGQSGVQVIDLEEQARWFTLDGVEISRPESRGLYIKVTPKKTMKVVI